MGGGEGERETGMGREGGGLRGREVGESERDEMERSERGGGANDMMEFYNMSSYC